MLKLLEDEGFVVRITHGRYIAIYDRKNKKYTRVSNKLYTPREYHDIIRTLPMLTLDPNGGSTTVMARKGDHRFCASMAWCHDDDLFRRKLGTRIALGRLLDDAEIEH